MTLKELEARLKNLEDVEAINRLQRHMVIISCIGRGTAGRRVLPLGFQVISRKYRSAPAMPRAPGYTGCR